MIINQKEQTVVFNVSTTEASAPKLDTSNTSVVGLSTRHSIFYTLKSPTATIYI